MSIDLFARLQQASFLEGLEPDDVRALASLAHEKELAAGATLFHEGEPTSESYLVLEGSVTLEVCASGIGCRRILTVEQGELLAWSPLLEQPRLTATARSAGESRLIAFDAGQVLALCAHRPQFGLELMRRIAVALSRRLTATRMQLINVYGPETLPMGAPDNAD